MIITGPRRTAIRSLRPSVQKRPYEKASHSHSARWHSKRTVCARSLAELATRVRNTCRTPGDHPATFEILTTPTTLQRRTFELLEHLRA